MSQTCTKCNVTIAAKDVLKCNDCNAYYHPLCTSSKKVGTRKIWKCEECTVDNVSNSSSKTGGESEHEPVLAAIAAFRADVTSRLDTVQSDLRAVTEQVNGLKVDLEVVKSQAMDTCEDVENIKATNAQLTAELQNAKRQIQDLQQHTRKNNLIISGIPVTRNEDIMAILRDVARAVGVNFDVGDISAAHRLPNKKGNKYPPSIIVCFVSRLSKSAWLSAKKQKQTLSASEINSTFAKKEVYFNEHMTAGPSLAFLAP